MFSVLQMFEPYRKLFPVLQRYLYLNHAGVAPTSTRVRDAAQAWLDDLVGHGIVHEEAWEEQATRVRGSLARLVGARPSEIAFVRNTSHGLGLVAEGLDWQVGDQVAVCRELEFPSNVYPWEHLASRGVEIRDISPISGGVTPAAVAEAITPRTRLVAVSSVQYASGHRTDLTALGVLCRESDTLLCVDGIQSVGAEPLNVREAGVHFLSADSHKWMLGINGAGFLYVAQEVQDALRPALVGWKSTSGAWDFDQARFELQSDAAKLEEGSPAYTSIYALGAATELLLEVGLDRISDRITALLDRLAHGLAALGADVSPARTQRAGILTFALRSRESQELADWLVERDVLISCRRGRLRVSPHFYTTDEEIDRFVALVREGQQALV